MENNTEALRHREVLNELAIETSPCYRVPVFRMFVFVMFFSLGMFAVSQTKEKGGLTIIGVGDIMLGTHFPSEKYLPPGDDPLPLIEVAFPVLHSADVVFGNLEGSYLDEGELVKRCKDTTKCYAFKTPVRYAHVLKDAGFRMFSVANNHIRDFGRPGMLSTSKVLDSLDIRYAGFVSRPYDTLTVKGKLVGLCAFSPNAGTVQITDMPGAEMIVRHLASFCDYVIVSFHGGAEGEKYQHITRETEEFYGENRGNVYEFAHKMIDAGADVVFGHGPHVARAVEVYGDRFIAYSLGNFCTYGRFNLRGANGLAPAIKVMLDDQGKFVKAKIYSFKQDKVSGLYIDPQNSVAKKIKDLTTYDFPELRGRLVIDDGGDIFVSFPEKMQHLGLPKPQESVLAIPTNKLN